MKENATRKMAPETILRLAQKRFFESCVPQNSVHFEQLLHEVWAELTIDDVAPFWESVSRRIESVIDAAGSWRKY